MTEVEVEQRGLCQQVRDNREGLINRRLIDGVRPGSRGDIKAPKKYTTGQRKTTLQQRRSS